MGSLSIPAAGVIYVDTQIVVYSVERRAPYVTVLEPLWQAADAGRIAVATSELTVLEVLVQPMRNGDRALQSRYEATLSGRQLQLIPIDLKLLRSAAALRASARKLRTPDAIHAATSLSIGATMFLSNDRGFSGAPSLPAVMLDDVLSAP